MVTWRLDNEHTLVLQLPPDKVIGVGLGGSNYLRLWLEP